MSYTWKIASKDEFPSIYELLCKCGLWLEWGIEGVKRRVTDPLNINHLISFYDNAGKLCGFLTLAHMNEEAESHQATVGVLPQDWRSGKNLWVVDFVAPYGGCYQMLSVVMRGVNPTVSKTARYFRKKTNQIRQVEIA